MTHTLTRPKMIFLDAAGTLIEVRGSVGEVYAGVAASFGVEVPAAEINQAFARLLPAHLPMIVPPNLSPQAHQQAEFDWWKDLARKVFAPHLPIENFDALFETLFRTFARAEAWHVFSDVVPALNLLRQLGIPLAVLSNFDSRLLTILEALGLRQFFDAVHFSTDLGYAKPDPRIFKAALGYHRLEPNSVWHVGDSLNDDVGGATAVGIQPIWLDRRDSGHKNSHLRLITRLDQLSDLFSKE